MSTLRTHKDYVKALAYAKEREQVNTRLILANLLTDTYYIANSSHFQINAYYSYY